MEERLKTGYVSASRNSLLSIAIIVWTLPIFAEICKRSARFVLSCLFWRSSLVRSITRHGIAARYDSVIGRNALVRCKWFDWSLTDFIHGTLSLSNRYFRQHFLNKITDAQRQSELFVHEHSLIASVCSI